MSLHDLCTAAAANDLPRVCELLGAGIGPNGIGYSGRTALAMASGALLHVGRGGPEAFFELVKAGADLHLADEWGGSILTALGCNPEATAAMVKAVIADGLRPSDKLQEALRYACWSGNLEVVLALLEAGAQVNDGNKHEPTPLLAAVVENRSEVVAELLARGARTDPKMPRQESGDKRYYKKTALEIALLQKYAEVVVLLRAAGATVPEKPQRPERAAGTVTESVKRIKKWLKAYACDWEALKKGARPKELAQAEAALGFALPPDLTELYKLHSATDAIFPNPDDIPFSLLTLSELAYIWPGQKRLLESGDFEGLTCESVAPGIQAQWWNTGWIPFAGNGGGDLYCLDLDPAPGGTSGQVISHHHETGQHKLLAPSLRDYLHRLADDLEDDKYAYSEGEGIV